MALYVYTAQEQPGLCQYYERQEEDNEDEEQQGPLSTGFANLISNSDSINQLARKGFTPVLEVAAVYQAGLGEPFLLRDSRYGRPFECFLNLKHLQDMAWGLAVGTRVTLLSYCSDHCVKRNKQIKQILKVHDFQLFNGQKLPPKGDLKKILTNNVEQQQQQQGDAAKQPKEKTVPPRRMIQQKTQQQTPDHLPPDDDKDAEDNKYGVHLITLNPSKFGLTIWNHAHKSKCDDSFAQIVGVRGQIAQHRVLCLREDCMAVLLRSNRCLQRHLDDHKYFDNLQWAAEQQQSDDEEGKGPNGSGEAEQSSAEIPQTEEVVVKEEPVDDENPTASTSQPNNPQDNHSNDWNFSADDRDQQELSTGFLELFFKLNPTDPIPEVTPVLAIAVVYLGQFGEPFWVRDHPTGGRCECYLRQELKPMVIGQPEGTRVIIGHYSFSFSWTPGKLGRKKRKIMIIKDMKLFMGDHLPKSAINFMSPVQPEPAVETPQIEREPIIIDTNVTFDSLRFEKVPWIRCSHEILPKYFCFLRLKRGPRKGEFVKYVLCMPCYKVLPRQECCAHLRDKHGVSMLWKNCRTTMFRDKAEDNDELSNFEEAKPSTSLQSPEVSGQNVPQNPESSDLVLKSGEIVPIFGPEEQRLKALREMVAVVKQQIAESKAPKPPKPENEKRRRNRLKQEADAARADSVWHYFEKPEPKNQHRRRQQCKDVIRCKHCDYTERPRYASKNNNGNLYVRGLLLHLERAHPELFRVRKQVMDAQRKKEMRNKREITVEALEDGTFELHDWVDETGRLRKYGELYKDVLKKGVQTRQIICSICLEQEEECVVFSKYNNKYYSAHYRWHIGRGELGGEEDGEQEDVNFKEEMEEEEEEKSIKKEEEEEGEEEEEEGDDEEEESEGMEYDDDQNDEDFVP